MKGEERCSRFAISRPPTGRARCCTASISSVMPGEIVALVGRNGMGKSTLMKSLIGVMPARVGADRGGRRRRDRARRAISASPAGSPTCRRAGRSSAP